MAVVTVPEENLTIEDAKEIADFLVKYGITYERWPLEDRVDPDATDQDILDAYDAELRPIMQRGGYVTADVINITPDTPNLDAMLAKFNKEHTHSEDEVRFILKGRGIFHIDPDDDPVFTVQTEAGDMINVPAGTKHWFNLCEEDRTIRAVRLFQDKTGWTPHYVDDGAHGQFIPVCWGPRFVPPAETIKSVINL